jgi:23S rRNA (adenine1618-N6)-methyltransferase
LIEALPDLGRFVQPHPLAGDTIDFANPAAVTTLNRALLNLHYGITSWDLPAGYLCPPIPSRADYLHHVADLLAEDDPAAISHRPDISVLDIGSGANCVYPLIGVQTYGWRFVGTDVDPAAVDWARQLVSLNPPVVGRIECRLQPSAETIFKNVTRLGEWFALSMCNPPFHSSPEEAAAGTLRKLRNLADARSRPPSKLALNFGGRSHELWCPGGEVAFVRRMIAESVEQPELCGWFTTLVSKRGSLPVLGRDLQRARVSDFRILTMFAGQKQTRVLAWTFLPANTRKQRILKQRVAKSPSSAN